MNRNHDGWPSVELAGSQDIFDRHHASGGFTVEASKDAEFGFSTFLGKPIFVDHHNSNPDRARGVIVDAKLHVEDGRTAAGLDPYYATAPSNHKPPTWVELLLEVDAKSFPKLAKAIVEGAKNSKSGIDGFSMGCNVEMSKCSHCGNEATSPDDYCEHIQMKGRNFPYTDGQGRTSSRRSYEDCYGIQFFEISAVFDPADETALIREVRSSVDKEGAGWDDAPDTRDTAPQDPSFALPCPDCKGVGYQGEIACPNCGGTGKEGGYLSAPQRNDGGSLDLKVKDTMRLPDKFPALGTPMTGPRIQGKVAQDNPLPQSELLRSPEQVNTLRDEIICPVCGETMDEETCPLCGYVQEPDGFNNPDLTKADNSDLRRNPAPPKIPLEDTELQDKTIPVQTGAPPRKPGFAAHVTGDMAKWTVITKHAGRINTNERPIRPGNGQATGEPVEQILSDQVQPVTSSVRTAGEFIAAVERDTGDNMKTADAASGAPEVATPDKRVDVEGVGGSIDASNESASKADAQVDPTAQGGTGVENVSADQENVNVDQGNEKSKNIEVIPTKTFGDGSSAVERQADPVSSEPFPSSDQGVKKSHDDAAYPKDDGGVAGGSAVQGVQPVAEQFGERVDVLDSVTSPANNSGPTTTWSGTDGNGVTRQADPVTPESIATEGFGKGSSAHLFTAFKLADLEVELGLLGSDRKMARVAELEGEEPAAVIASLQYAQRVKTAGLSKGGSQKTAKRLPSLARSASVVSEEAPADTITGDASIFM